MGTAAILALIQAAVGLVPAISAAVPAVENLLKGTGTDADVATLEAVTATLNAQAQAAEVAAGATLTS